MKLIQFLIAILLIVRPFVAMEKAVCNRRLADEYKKILHDQLAQWKKPKEIASLENKEVHGVTRAVYSPDGEYIAAASAGGGYNIKIWKTHTPFEQVQQLSSTPYGLPMALSYNADGKILASGDSLIRIWNPETGKLDCTIGENIFVGTNITNLQFSPDNKQLAINSLSSKETHFWDSQTHSFNKIIADEDFMYGGLYNPMDSTQYITYSDTKIKIWSLKNTIKPQQVIVPERALTINFFGKPVTYNNSSSKIAIAAYKNRVYEYDAKSGALLAILNGFGKKIHNVMPDESDNEPQSLAYTPDDTMLAIGVLDAANKAYIAFAPADYNGEPHKITAFNTQYSSSNIINALEFDKNNSQFAAASMGGQLKVWDVPYDGFEVVKEMILHDIAVQKMQEKPVSITNKEAQKAQENIKNLLQRQGEASNRSRYCTIS
jgi:WD40 repeat protein